MIELTKYENELIEQNMAYLERDDYDGFFAQIGRKEYVYRIKAFMYESLNIDTYDYSSGEISRATFGSGWAVMPETYVVPDSVKSIAEYTFKYADNLKKLVISDSVEKIAAYAIYECEDLEEVIFPNNPRYDYIAPNTIRACHKIKKIWIPDSVVELTGESVGADSIKTEGKYMFAHWREDPDKQITIRQSDVPVFREHFQFID